MHKIWVAAPGNSAGNRKKCAEMHKKCPDMPARTTQRNTHKRENTRKIQIHKNEQNAFRRIAPMLFSVIRAEFLFEKIRSARSAHQPLHSTDLCCTAHAFCIFCVLYCTGLCCTALYCTALHLPCFTALHHVVLHSTVLHPAMPHCAALHRVTLYCTLLSCLTHCTALYCTVLHCTVPRRTVHSVPHCIVIHYSTTHCAVFHCAV